MQLFYNADINETTPTISFDKEESRHLVKVLRHGPGDRIQLTNGNGLLATAALEQVSPKAVTAVIIESKKVEPMAYKLHMAVAPTKMHDRFEWFLEKATEIGVTEITPILCDHSERKVIKPERYEKILISAMKQSRRSYLPLLNTLTPFRDFIDQHSSEAGVNTIAHCDLGKKKSLRDLISPGTSVTVLIGPEGDFSQDEITFALDHQWTAIGLGDYRLRTETAAIVACQNIAFLNESH